jgi:hypothetical protein
MRDILKFKYVIYDIFKEVIMSGNESGDKYV